mmetsp:Transcript_47836/g.119763  ORF Transcript_47836/g.119763 Transcript_47836/m.119763 type:complete len:292 (-) Transcript_47836:139-1014(-)
MGARDGPGDQAGDCRTLWRERRIRQGYNHRSHAARQGLFPRQHGAPRSLDARGSGGRLLDAGCRLRAPLPRGPRGGLPHELMASGGRQCSRPRAAAIAAVLPQGACRAHRGVQPQCWRAAPGGRTLAEAGGGYCAHRPVLPQRTDPARIQDTCGLGAHRHVRHDLPPRERPAWREPWPLALRQLGKPSADTGRKGATQTGHRGGHRHGLALAGLQLSGQACGSGSHPATPHPETAPPPPQVPSRRPTAPCRSISMTACRAPQVPHCHLRELGVCTLYTHSAGASSALLKGA